VSPKSRSCAYPALDLREAVNLLRQLVEDLDFQEGDRDSIARMLGHSGGLSGAAGRKVAALVHFGLLERRESKYCTTALALHICNSISEESLRSALRRAFLAPSLFRDLIDAYLPAGSVPRYLAQDLRDHGVTEAAKHDVARIFMASAEYAGVLAADGVFLDEKPEVTKPVVATALKVPALVEVAPAMAVQPTSLVLDPEVQTLRFFVTDRKVVEMRFPAGLNEDDIVLVKKQIEFLELQVRLFRPAATLPFRRPGTASESA